MEPKTLEMLSNNLISTPKALEYMNIDMDKELQEVKKEMQKLQEILNSSLMIPKEMLFPNEVTRKTRFGMLEL